MRNALAILAVAAASAAFAEQQPYQIFEIDVRNVKERQILTDSPLFLLNEDPTIGKNVVAVNQGNEWQVLALGLKYKYRGLYKPQIPSYTANEDVDYRTEWLNYDQIIAEWDLLLQQYPWLVTKRAIGTTHNGNTIWVYSIYKPDGADNTSPPASLLFLGNTHAREWASPSVLIHLGKMLCQAIATNDSVMTSKLVGKVGVHFVAVFNPDGYKYTWTNQRLWRKNRRNNGNNVYGVDMNRNYAKGWGGAGSSGTPSSDTYRGPSVWSEPENLAIKNFSESLPNLRGFIDYHSNSGDILWPWSYTTSPLAEPYLTTNSTVATAMKNAILAHPGGYNYTIGQGSTTLYVAGGTSKDWYLDRFGNIPSYTVEIYGSSFDPPTSTIAPTQDQHWVGFRAFIQATLP